MLKSVSCTDPLCFIDDHCRQAHSPVSLIYLFSPILSMIVVVKFLSLICCDPTNLCRTLLRRYPDFPDMRAALTAASWRQGNIAEAENNWSRVEDPRYADSQWLERWRRWPPQIRADLQNFLKLSGTPKEFATQ